MRVHLSFSCALLLTALQPTATHAQCDLRIPQGAPLPNGRTAPEQARGGGSLLVVPTVVHVHYGGGLAPLGPQHIQAMLAECNADLRATHPDIGEVVPAFQDVVGDMGFELRLATRDEQGNCMSGIRYHLYDPVTSAPEHLAVTLNTRGYLNVHIGANQSFATLPAPITSPYDPTDVIMLNIGQAAPGTHTLAHEVGHWAGLLHVWGLSNTTGTCGDDYIADTPITLGSQLDCIVDQAECSPGVVENVQNYMDYSNCRLMFTQGQAAYAQSVLNNPGLVRNNVVLPTNLLATGITDPSSCAITASIYQYAFVSCTGTTVRFRAMAEHALVDSVRWTFTGGNIATSTNEHIEVLYAAAGSYPVQLRAYGGGTSTLVNATVQVEVPTTTSNGLAMVTELPFTEGFEGDLVLPTANMAVVPNGSPTWQVFANAGHASERSLYLPAGAVDVTDTNDLVLGNFDLTALNVPTVQVKVASSMYGTAGWSSLHLLFRDQCSNIFVGEQWGLWQLNEYGADHGSNYIPSADGQWVTLQASFPAWNMATSAELVLRVVRPAYPASFTAEPFYLDDVYVGELPLVTGMANAAAAAPLRLAPNPSATYFTVQVDGAAMLLVTDALGRVVLQQPLLAGPTTVAHTLPPGPYLVRVGNATQRLVVQ
ncbi:MAG: PKD domain-containing protein [Flavobacteriales bacterium]|nr:PKD domain-containing protein [Flavobacteriales bacterium]